MTRSDLTEEEVIDAFLLEDSTDSRTLAVYLERHPKHAEALLDLAHEIAFSEVSQSAPPAPDEDQLIAKGWATIQASAKKAVTIADWTAAVLGKMQGTVGAPMPIFMNLRDRRFELETLPSKLLNTLATCLETTRGAIEDYLQQPGGLAKGAAYKSIKAPQVADEKLDYAAFLRDLGLSEDEQRRLLDGSD